MKSSFSQPLATTPLLLSLLPLAILLSGCGRSMMPTPLVYQDASTPVLADLAPELRGDRLAILYVTDRKPASADTGGSRFYTSGRSTSSVLGGADVKLGRKSGSPEQTAGHGAKMDRSAGPVSPPGIEVVSVEELIRFPATPYSYTVGERGRIIPDPEMDAELEQATAAARREVARRLSLTPKKEVFVFVHGVGNQFDDAIISAAETWHFLGREGVPIAYTWPAGAKGPIFYTADRESGEFTILHLKQFLRILATIPEVEKIHIAAHSRGADVATTALRELIIESRAAGVDPRARYKIENLVLVSADLDLDVALQRTVGEALAPAYGRLTIYTNAKDSALAMAKFLYRSRQRVGTLTPTTLTSKQRGVIERVANLDIIVYEEGGGGFFRHGYFRDPVAGSDMLMLLRYGWEPGEGQRQGLERIGPKIWRLRDRARDH